MDLIQYKCPNCGGPLKYDPKTGNDRRLARNYELLFENAENMVKIAAIKLLLNKI